MINPYIIGAVVLALVASHGFAYHKGKARERDKATASALQFREKEQKLIAELDQAKQRREVIYRDRENIVKETSDACLGTDYSVVIGGVLQSLGDPSQRSTDD